MDYETEEQQVEALKKWWKENGSLVIAGVVLGAAIIVGWRFYMDYKKTHAETASAMYHNVTSQITANKNLNEIEVQVNDLMAEYSDTPYATLSALMLAKKQLSAGDLVKAQQQLEWVIKNTKQAELQFIARLRLARILMASDKLDDASKLIDIDYPESFAALFEELKGDLYVAQGMLDQARVAYDKAILGSDGQASKWLKLKRDDLGASNKTEPSA